MNSVAFDKGMLKLSKFDAADYLKTDEDITTYLDIVASENDPQAFLQALNTVARAKGMTNISQKSGIPRESLYQSLSNKGNPQFYTLWNILAALGFTLSIRKRQTV